MKEIYNIKQLSCFRELVDISAKKYSRRNAFILREGKSKYRKIKYKELKDRYYCLCSYFLSQGLRGKSIAVIGGNCYEWTLCYLAAASVGTVVPLDKELSVEDIDNFLEFAECQAVCADRKTISALSFQSKNQYGFYPFDSVDEEYSLTPCCDFKEINQIEISKDETSVLIFTSGTTGNAKGVCLSQHNLLSDIRSTLSIVKVTSKDRTLSILPLHHTYECTLNCLLMLSVGACITYADSLLKVTKNVMEYSPSVLVVVPALLKMIDKKITRSVAENCPEKYKSLFVGEPFSQAFGKLPSWIRNIISSRVKKSLGGNLRLFIVGAADLDSSIVENFCAMGIRVLQGYGLTECAPLVAGNSDFYFNAKSTGRAIPGVDMKINEPNAEGIGEILVKGENVMLGYFKDENATAKVFEGGWFHTGDLGRMDADGGLYITGRSKNVIVTENGKNVYPEELEARLSGFPEIEDVLVVASQERGKLEVKAKIFPNIDVLKSKIGHVPSLSDIKNY
ncbi:MAG: AMP-binding protein, partial [Clostridia bacterium]|nr:AMP-binding protein [Clostridia bacterium]